MDTREATDLLRQHLDGYRRRTYDDLVGLHGRPQVAALRGVSGGIYQVEVEVYWDGRPGGAIRVLGSIDDGGLRIVQADLGRLILAPDGKFLGESSTRADGVIGC